MWLWWNVILDRPGELVVFVNLEPWVDYPVQEHERSWASVTLGTSIMLKPPKSHALKES